MTDAERQQVRSLALDEAARYVSQNSLTWRFSCPWHGKDFAKEIRNLAQEELTDELG